MSVPVLFQSEDGKFYTYNTLTNDWEFVSDTKPDATVFDSLGMADMSMLNKKILLDIPGISEINPKIKLMTYKEKGSANGPGPTSLIGGDLDAGYYGTVSSSEFITGDDLASMLGLTAGTSQYSDTDWLKFSSDGKTIFSPMKPIRHTISWDDINKVNAVYGDRIIEIGGLQYKVRLWRGANFDPANGYNGEKVKQSEWNKLMLPIHEKAKDQSWTYSNNVNIPTENWGIGFTDEDLLTHRNYGNGSYSWCQEVAESTAYRVIRGSNGVSNSASGTSSYSPSHYGFRPVLELF